MPTVLMAFTYPETLRQAKDEAGNLMFTDSGRPMLERIPSHPTRLATSRDFNTWRIEVSGEELEKLIAAGAIVED